MSVTNVSDGSEYNEAEVRFHIVDPILRDLGYGISQNTYLKLEERLDYPYIHIGHRSKKDVPLGFPDYRAGLKGARGSFIVETKAGSRPITKIDVEQAHSYAAHAQVGANYFVLCNGIEFQIYETLSGSNNDPIVTIPISRLSDSFYEIENVLSPLNLEKHCKVEYDSGLKICDGLRSRCSIVSGSYTMSDCQYRMLIGDDDVTEIIRANVPHITKFDLQIDMLKSIFELRVKHGNVVRDESGRIIANARFAGATLQNAEAMRMLGVDEISFTTADKFISTDHDNPTMLEATKDFSLREGAMIPELLGGFTQIDSEVEGGLFVKISMYFDGREMLGQYISFSEYYVDISNDQKLKVELDVSGDFVLRPAV